MTVSNKRRTAIISCLLIFFIFMLTFVIEDQDQVVQVPADDVNANILERIRVPNMFSSSDPELIAAIQDQLLHPPSLRPYNFSRDVAQLKMKGGNGQAVLIDRLLKAKRNGYFIEAGAFDGEFLSNTLYLELKRNWTGLLVEPNSKAFGKLLSKHRKSHAIHACLSTHDYPEAVTFDSADVYGRIIGGGDKEDHDKDKTKSLEMLRSELDESDRFQESVQCLPLHSLILAMGNPRVDYFSLDVEGAELAVLKTIPFDQVDIRTLTVEVIHSNSQDIVRHLVNNGYKVQRRLETDIVFVKNL